ncbi:DNA cytosine methyltransferase [Propionibacterium freudenreichii]|uniref:DNA cytosine methyltransferase n=1 Tax=Propionibacterium freudenreichii TaxID=1744 RepID=UPI0035CF3955
MPPVDILCGGFPCQDVSTVGKRAGLAPGTRSGLWAQMAAAIETLQPQFVVIENVRGLLSTKAIRPTQQGATPDARNRHRCHRSPSRPGTRPVECGRPASPTSTGAWRRTRRPGRPPV